MYLCGGRYKVIGKLGEGGYGSVYLAEDRVLDSTWAIKDMGICDDVSYAVASAEISVLSKVSHPGIVRITDVFRSEGHIYMVMDHIKGLTLRSLMRGGRAPSEGMVYAWALELCDAVSYLHNMEPPVILRDIKPQNIMVRPDGHLVLIDFGASALHDLVPGKSEAYMFGSRAWAAPEQLGGGTADVRSDIYALGKVLELITKGSKPFGMTAIIKRCTMEEPRHRYRSVAGIRRDLVIAHHAGRVAVAAVLFLVGGLLFISRAKAGTRAINESAAIGQDYEQGLMCFYELHDYEAALGYLMDVPEDEYPEVPYYKELCTLLMDGYGNAGKVYDALQRFEKFNEETVRNQDKARYVKNLFCMAEAYVSADPVDGYERAYGIAAGILSLNDASSEEGALRLMINALIVRGRNEVSNKEDSYHEAIEYIDRLIEESKAAGDDEAAVSRLMDKASLYTELEEYDEALAAYEEAEKGYPFATGIKYFAHLSLLMQLEASREEVVSVWDEACKVEGIENDKGYDLMKERIENYEASNR